jgi:hypothetical protein
MLDRWDEVFTRKYLVWKGVYLAIHITLLKLKYRRITLC